MYHSIDSVCKAVTEPERDMDICRQKDHKRMVSTMVCAWFVVLLAAYIHIPLRA
jgi:hypothetical protein